MTARYRERLFTEAVREAQAALNGRALGPAPGDGAEGPGRDRLGPDEAAFIASRDSFYMATVSASGWPYVQHRGGPPGFIQARAAATRTAARRHAHRRTPPRAPPRTAHAVA